MSYPWNTNRNLESKNLYYKTLNSLDESTSSPKRHVQVHKSYRIEDLSIKSLPFLSFFNDYISNEPHFPSGKTFSNPFPQIVEQFRRWLPSADSFRIHCSEEDWQSTGKFLFPANFRESHMSDWKFVLTKIFPTHLPQRITYISMCPLNELRASSNSRGFSEKGNHWDRFLLLSLLLCVSFPFLPERKIWLKETVQEQKESLFHCYAPL